MIKTSRLRVRSWYMHWLVHIPKMVQVRATGQKGKLLCVSCYAELHTNPPSTAISITNEHCENQNWSMERHKKVGVSHKSHFHILSEEIKPAEAVWCSGEYFAGKPAFQASDVNPTEYLWDLMYKQVCCIETPPQKEFKDLLLMSSCQIPQHTFRTLVEITVILAVQVRPTQY